LDSKDTPTTSPTNASTLRTPPEGHSRGKRSIDGGKPSEGSRLSFFGGTLGKSRKPAPRVSGDSTTLVEPERSARGLSKILGTSHKRPTTREGSKASTSPHTEKDFSTLRKRTISQPEMNKANRISLKPGQSIVDQIGEADYSGWMRKRGERYNTWKMRYFVLKGPHLYYLRSRNETKLKGYINIFGYKVIADENVNPGRYGFRIIHETDKTHYFSSEEQMVVREWMKALMKATIDRDYTKPVISSCNIPTIPLTVAQAMNPSPRPPSPSAREATQRALRRENPNQLSSRDARILMGLPSADPELQAEAERKRLESFFTIDTVSSGPKESMVPANAPPRPSRDQRKPALQADPPSASADADLIKWINSHLPKALHINDLSTSLSTGLVLFRLAEAIKGRPSDVPDSAFPSGPHDDRLEGVFKLFDFLLDNDIKTGSVSINDVRQGKRDKIILLVKALKAWEDKRLAVVRSIGTAATYAGPWLAPVSSNGNW